MGMLEEGVMLMPWGFFARCKWVFEECWCVIFCYFIGL